jgi:hypothetical protein
MHEIREPHSTVQARRRNAAKGGLKTASTYPLEVRREWGRKGGLATQEKYSNEFFGHIRGLRRDTCGD